MDRSAILVERPFAATQQGNGRASSGMFAPLLVALAAALVRLPWLGVPLRSDEAGYLLAASQWSPGPSTYGRFFVDRPPVLMGVYALADAFGGAVPLRLIGLAVVVSAVLAAGALGGAWGAGTAAVFLSTPLFDVAEVDGEILAVPLVLWGIVLIVAALRSQTLRGCAVRSVGAGVLAASAFLVKQNAIDVFVVALVLLLAAARVRGWRAPARVAGWFGAAALAAMAIAAAWSASRGTNPVALWDAVVTFRSQAADVIASSANDATPGRFRILLVALLASGAVVVVCAAVRDLWRSGHAREVSEEQVPGLRWAAFTLLAWEVAGCLIGGSYWQHYLIALTPGLVMLVALAGSFRWRALAVTVAAVSTLLAVVGWDLRGEGSSSSQQVAAYVRERARPGDSIVVGFGHPEIVYGAGLTSPYRYLWSLPVRVRDPRLAQLRAVLVGAQAPRWVVVAGDSLDTWGVDATSAQHILDLRYHQVTVLGDWHVLERS